MACERSVTTLSSRRLLALKLASQKETPPDEGSVVRLNLSQANLAIGRPEMEDQWWTGHVVRRSSEWLTTTGTDFCVCVTKPVKADSPQRLYEREEHRPIEQLQSVRIEVKFNEEPSIRGINAMKRFCNEQYLPELLNEVRTAIVSNPSQATPIRETDLSWVQRSPKSGES